MPLYLGFDCGTQGLTAIVLDVEAGVKRVVVESALTFDEALPKYGTHHGVLPNADPAVAASPPLMWADALDVMMARLGASSLDLSALAAISGSAQQHGSVYLSARAGGTLERLDSTRGIADQVGGIFSRPQSPIWMDTSTPRECEEIAVAVGGAWALAQRTGSRAFERFTGPQIRKFFRMDPAGYAATARIHLVSSFLATLLAGRDAPIDPGDGSGMNLMDLQSRAWWEAALEATAPDLATRLPPIAPSSSIVGALSQYWRDRYGLPPAAVVVWSGDNPCSLIGTGLVSEGRVAISLGTSDTIFGPMDAPRVDASGTGHVFGSPTGAYMALTAFRNGSLARERVRDLFGMTWTDFSRALETTSPANGGAILLPWFEPEITPPVPIGGVHCFGLDPEDGPANVRAVVEAQMMAMALHSRWMGVRIETIHATGGAAVNRAILQVMADVFGADVYQLASGNSACLGAALRAYHAHAASSGNPIGWDEVVKGIAEPILGSRVRPRPEFQTRYRELIERYAECEAQVLTAGSR